MTNLLPLEVGQSVTLVDDIALQLAETIGPGLYVEKVGQVVHVSGDTYQVEFDFDERGKRIIAVHRDQLKQSH